MNWWNNLQKVAKLDYDSNKALKELILCMLKMVTHFNDYGKILQVDSNLVRPNEHFKRSRWRKNHALAYL